MDSLNFVNCFKAAFYLFFIFISYCVIRRSYAAPRLAAKFDF